MYELPNGHPGTMGRSWYPAILSNLLAYYEWCKEDKGDALEFTRSVAIAMLQMDAGKRPSARKCLENCQRLRTSLDHTEDRDAGIGANDSEKAHPNGSFPPNALDESEGDEAAAKTSSTARWNSGGMSKAGREPQNFRNEDRATVTDHEKTAESLLGSISSSPPSVGEEELYDPSSILPWPPSIGGGKLYDPANIIPWSASIRETLDDAGRTGEDGSVTPGRRAPYHPGDEVAAPGRGFFPPSPWVSSPGLVRSGKSEPSRRQGNKPARRSARGP